MIVNIFSLLFGFLKLGSSHSGSEAQTRRSLLQKTINHLDQLLAHCAASLASESQPLEEAAAVAGSFLKSPLHSHEELVALHENLQAQLDAQVEPRLLLVLAHCHLLLEDFHRALSAYLVFQRRQPLHWKIPSFLYGLALCHFHFGSYNECIDIFQQLLYIDTAFPRTNEVRLRLAFIYKLRTDFELSLRHYLLALNDASPCTLVKAEVRFHIAHLLEVCGKIPKAKEAYEQLALREETPAHVKALCYRQLGWLYHSDSSGTELCSSSLEQRQATAANFLEHSIRLNSRDNGKTYYLLGRCFSAVSKVHEAFMAYRSSIDKLEACADTWCSIGVLYQQQNQPMDALQAYVCAVQLDKGNVAAWTDLGVLYEWNGQLRDALTCYSNAVKADARGEVSKLTKLNLLMFLLI